MATTVDPCASAPLRMIRGQRGLLGLAARLLLLGCAAVLLLPTLAQPARAAPTPDRVRVDVERTGLYVLAAADIATALQLPRAEVQALIRSGGLGLTSRGLPVSVLAGTGGGALYFYGEGLESIYTRSNVYWLSRGEAAPIKSEAAPVGPGGGSRQFTATVHAERDLVAAPGLFHDPESDFWLWGYLVAGSPEQSSRSFAVKTPGARGGGALVVSLQGFTATDISGEHHAAVSLNGKRLGEGRWQGATAHELRFAIPAGTLKAGRNIVKVRALLDAGVTHSVFGVDALDVKYSRAATAVADQLLLRVGTAHKITVGGLSTTRAWVFDLADPRDPRLLGSTATGGAPGVAWVSFGTAAGREYVVSTAAGALRPRSMTGTVAPGLRDPCRAGADYVVITSPRLGAAADSLATYRTERGLGCAVVTTREVYDDFSFGVATPHAIRSFIEYTLAEWRPAPRFVVLAGDGSYDYKDDLGMGPPLVPPLMADTPYGLAVSDVRLADVTGGDGVPEVLLGRIPARTTEEPPGLLGQGARL